MALHKVQIMARDTSTAKEDYINLTDHKLAVDIGTTPDTAAGDFSDISNKLTQKVQFHENIDFSDASAQTIIDAPGTGNRIRLTRLSLVSGSNPQVNVEVALKTGSTTIETVKGAAMVFDYPEHRNLGTNEAFVVQATTADRIIGGVDYYVEAV
jgi:hypothetical protein